jgi:hypothetical protein
MNLKEGKQAHRSRHRRCGMHVESVDTPSLLELRAMVARRLRAYAAFEGCTVEDRRAILAQACLVIWRLTAGGDPHARVTW